MLGKYSPTKRPHNKPLANLPGKAMDEITTYTFQHKRCSTLSTILFLLREHQALRTHLPLLATPTGGKGISKRRADNQGYGGQAPGKLPPGGRVLLLLLLFRSWTPLRRHTSQLSIRKSTCADRSQAAPYDLARIKMGLFTLRLSHSFVLLHSSVQHLK